MAWLDGFDEHHFILEPRLNGPTVVALALAFLTGVNRAQCAWLQAQAQLWAALQALPVDPYQWPGVTVTPNGTLELINAQMNVDNI